MSRIGKFEWLALYIISGAIDVIQFFLPGISLLPDVFIGIIFFGYFQLRGVSLISHPSILVSLFGVAGLETITGGIAPAWIIDVWYIHKVVRKERALYEQNEQQEILLGNIAKRPLYNNGIRKPIDSGRETNTSPQNIDGIRLPNGGLK